MYRSFPALLLCILFNQLTAQTYPGTWNGAAYYAPGQPMATVMQKMGAKKLLFLDINPSNNVTGSLVVSYDKSRALIANDGGDQVFTIAGRIDTNRQQLLLVLTHVKTNGNLAVLQKPDSIYYAVQLLKGEKKLSISGAADKARNKNVSSEWIGSAQGQGLGMNISDNIGMHMLPLSFRLENTYSPAQSAAKEDFSGPLPGITVTGSARKTEIQRTILLDTSFITIDLYDNGEIDGDIATIILDGKTILDKQTLGSKAATLSLELSKESSEHILQLYADNLGSIPPNTALLVLTCNKKRYEIYLSSNGMVNGSVKLIFKSG